MSGRGTQAQAVNPQLDKPGSMKATMPRPPKNTGHMDKVSHLMGTMPDHEIAELCGSTPSIVGRYRRKMGIPAYEGYKFGVGQAPPSKKKARRSDKPAKDADKPKVSGRSKLDPFRDLIGTLPDSEIAGRAGVTNEAVRMYRRRHKIARRPADASRRRKAPAVVETVSATSAAPVVDTGPLVAFADLIGRVPDAEVAAMTGVPVSEVEAWRRARGIEAQWKPETKLAPAAVAAPVAAPVAASRASRPLQGYRVEGTSGGDAFWYLIVASDIAEAAGKAAAAILSKHKGAEISAIRHLGPALA